MKYRWVYAVLAITVAVIPNGAGAPAPDWRDDKANIEIVRELNRAYRRFLFPRSTRGCLKLSDRNRLDGRAGPPTPWQGFGVGPLWR